MRLSRRLRLEPDYDETLRMNQKTGPNQSSIVFAVLLFPQCATDNNELSR
jgi:hypothetical protein